jgi:Kef-type K+ transport system membrane component KefB
MDAILLIGLAVLAGFAVSRLVRLIRLPQVVGYVAAGIVIGPGLNLVDKAPAGAVELISAVALGFIGFAIGAELRIDVFRRLGKSILWITWVQCIGAFIVVTLGVWLLSGDAALALIIGAVATATAPAATVAVLREYHARGVLTTTLYAVIGLDDAAALIIYGLSFPVAKLLMGVEADLSIIAAIFIPLKEIFISIFLGLAVGLIAALFARRLRNPEELLILAIGAVLVTSGLCRGAELSLILANITLGVVLINASPAAGRRLLAAVNSFTPPIYILFFVLVGAKLEPSRLGEIGVIGVAYIFLRTIGKWGGSYLGARISRAEAVVRRYLGMGLFTQAGVAMGLALMAVHDFSGFGPAGVDLGIKVINVTVATTFLFEIIGPPFVRYILFKSGEARQTASPSDTDEIQPDQ